MNLDYQKETIIMADKIPPKQNQTASSQSASVSRAAQPSPNIQKKSETKQTQIKYRTLTPPPSPEADRRGMTTHSLSVAETQASEKESAQAVSETMSPVSQSLRKSIKPSVDSTQAPEDAVQVPPSTFINPVTRALLVILLC